ncbi:malate synthase G [Thioclava electrotropha]|uniref:Malate synthase G n=1 Tax=Thioclava electrotropha TaxID=1549850 RepID=A0ABX6YWR6_9RHOB|nr:malate synthase G [Thioclava electrotropha]QPZ91648.1 malate synthase G [Thioclava electrotropha]
MAQRVARNELQVAVELAAFIEDQALPGTGVAPERFWEGLSDLLHTQGQKNRALLETRESIQSKLDDWHAHHRAEGFDFEDYKSFLKEIGYLLPEGDDFKIETPETDPEFATVCGPQLVVPITNARYALNAANARWGSLYDALYGTDALGDLPQGKGYDPERGARVIERAKAFLDEAVPLAGGSWTGVTALRVENGVFFVENAVGETGLADPAQFLGFNISDEGALSEVLLKNNGLHLVIEIDPTTEVGQADPADIADVILEAAISTIMDCEDSVACVDAEDKVQAYGNWLGLMKGDLRENVVKNGEKTVRRLEGDYQFTGGGGEKITLKGRSLMLVRNVGHLMTTPAILTRDGEEAFEGLMDAMVTTLCAMHDLKKTEGPRNSVTGSVYVVKPKMHGPEEVAFATEIFDKVEEVLGLPRYTVKLGIMDEERRTSVNLKECIRAAKNRVAFINTGFLDRTGDEIYTSMQAGPMLAKGEMKGQPWIEAYEDRNVDIGLACGLAGKAQIGKGMWAMPDRMADMLEAKVNHPLAGANCAWVPSPTAATLHATHYHKVDVKRRQQEIAAMNRPARLDDLLMIPLARGKNYSEEEIRTEIENNAQGILGYVVRWVDQGVGCSKVPDIHDVGLMEDRATCRISSQAIANWLEHGLVSEGQVMEALRKMAKVVDRQNEGDPNYRPMAPGYDGFAFQAACDLCFLGTVQPSGYTEPVLHQRRLQVKEERA